MAEAKLDDPFAPVTIVCPSPEAARFVRRVLGSATIGPRRGVVNLRTTTLGEAIGTLAAPVLASQGLRRAAPGTGLEAIRTEARTLGGWPGQFVAHARSLTALERTLLELGRCPSWALEQLATRHDRTAELVRLLRGVRRRLHAAGLVDEYEIPRAALAATAAAAGGVEKTGERTPTLLTWHLGFCPEPEASVLRRLGARRVDESRPSSGLAPARSYSEVRPCADAEEEARTAVREVIDAAERGVPLWAQAVLHPPSAAYAGVLFRNLAGAGVAARGPAVRTVAPSATARALLGLVGLATGEWEREEVVGWVASAPICAGPGGPLVRASDLDLVSAAAGVVRGREQWQARLARRAAERGAEDLRAEPLSTFVAGLARRTRAPGRSWAEHARWALELLDFYVDPAAAAERGPAREVAAAAAVRRVTRSLAELDVVSDGTDAATFGRTLRTQLERAELDSDEAGGGPAGGGVLVGSFGAARGLCLEQVVTCGLADALFPGPGDPDPLLGEEVRRSDPSGNLRTCSQAREELREELLDALEACPGRRVATLPRCDPRTGAAHVPSRWLGELVPRDTPWRPVDSFAAALAGPGPALSVHDLELRTLERWVSCGGDAARSPLVRADARLAAGFDAVRGRRGPRFGRFDGLVGPGAVSPFDPETPVSATRFETYARCPRRYLLERELGVSRRVRPEELWRIEPHERGTLVHGILEAYVAERLAGAPRSLDRLLALAEEHLDRAEESVPVGKPLLWRTDRSTILRELRRFHAEEADLRPLAVELAFGNSDGEDSPPVIVALEDGREVRFRGRADRVDLTAGGRLVVSDYKTGRQSGLGDLVRDPVAAGTLLQLPLYGLAAKERFGSNGPVHARYWLLSNERSAPCYHLVLTEAVEARFREVVAGIASGVESGCFPGVPGARRADGTFDNCRSCDFDRVCPPERDRQWRRKRADLAATDVLRLADDESGGGWAGSVVRGFVDPDHVQAAPHGEAIE